MVNRGTAIYAWDIKDVVFQSKVWVCSPDGFILKGNDEVEFSLELRAVNTNGLSLNKLQVRIRKSDPKPAHAVVEVALKTKDSVDSINWHHVTSSNQNALTAPIYPNYPCVRKKIDDWKGTYVFEDLLNASSYYTTILMRKDLYCIAHAIIKCSVTWHGFNETAPASAEQSNLQQCSTIYKQSFYEYLNSDKFHDVVLIVGQTELPAHKIILSKRSQFFDKMLTTDMKESKDSRINIKNFRVEAIREMLKYFYTNTTEASSDINVALEMIEVAEVYQIIELKKICEDTMVRKMAVDNVLDIFCAAYDFHATELRDQSIQFMIRNKSEVIDLPQFEELFKIKPLLIREFLTALCKKM